MNRELIVKKVGTYYRQYLERGSGIMLNANTDYFFDNLLSIPYCKHIVDHLISHNNVPAHLLEERQEKSYLEFFEDMTKHGQEYYIAYCIQSINIRENTTAKHPIPIVMKRSGLILSVRSMVTDSNYSRQTSFVQ